MKNTLIIAHRGLSSLYPENTLLGFKKAIELGVDMIELDVHQTKDKRLVVMHDPSIDRTTDGKGRIARMTLKEIKSYSAGKWFSRKFSAEKVPTLQEVFETVGKKTGLRMEIKVEEIERELLKLIEKYHQVENIVCSSFNLKTIARIKRMCPIIPAAFLCDEITPDLIKELLAKNINMVDVAYSALTPPIPLLKYCHRYGFPVTVWTVDNEKDMERFLAMGVDAVCSNFPQILKRLVSKAKGYSEAR